MAPQTAVFGHSLSQLVAPALLNRTGLQRWRKMTEQLLLCATNIITTLQTWKLATTLRVVRDNGIEPVVFNVHCTIVATALSSRSKLYLWFGKKKTANVRVLLVYLNISRSKSGYSFLCDPFKNWGENCFLMNLLGHADEVSSGKQTSLARHLYKQLAMFTRGIQLMV